MNWLISSIRLNETQYFSNNSWCSVNIQLATANHENTPQLFRPCQELSAVYVHRARTGRESETNGCDSNALAIKLAGLILNRKVRSHSRVIHLVRLKVFDLRNPVTDMDTISHSVVVR